MKRAIIVILIIAGVGAGAGAYYKMHSGPDFQVNTAPITRGDIIDTVGATGTLQAVITVQVGSQVSGNISWLGADFNSIVKKDQVVAKLDPSLFEAQVQQAKANLLQATANQAKAQSDLDRAKVQLLDAQQKYTRSKELSAKNLVPQSDLDAAKIAVDTAQAALQSQAATVAQSKAAVTQSEASLNQNKVNLEHTIITAPIDGIVIQRSVDVGQTVQASMQAPTLFIIAADLTKMQVNANIDEADVGRIRPGQVVTFRVDAYPGEEFQGNVAQIRLQPVVVQNVTTYGTIVDVPNQDLRLKPGMTANLKVQIAKRTDVTRIPNASLRFRPNTDIFAALNQPVPPEALSGPGGRGGRGGGGKGNAANQAAPGGATAQNAEGPQSSHPSQGSKGPASATGVPGTTSASAEQGVVPNGGSRLGGGQGGRGGSGGAQGADNADRQARMMDRFKAMSADEQKQFIARMKDRGQDASAFEKAAVPTAKHAPNSKSDSPVSALMRPKYGAAQSAETIDALFKPLKAIETQGRAWLYADKQLKAVRLRLGITDGTNTELLSGELQPETEVVTSVILGGSARPTAGGQGSGNPLMPQRGGGPGGRGR